MITTNGRPSRVYTTFLEYLAMRRHEESPVGDLARDAVDFRLLEPSDIQDLVEQLMCYGDVVANTAAQAWLDYRAWQSTRPRSRIMEDAA